MKGKLFIGLFLLIAGALANAQSESGPSGCRDVSPMMQSDFSIALKTVKKQGTEDVKLSAAEEIAGHNCLSTGQIAEFCKLFGFEETKLKFAKFAYDHCTEPQNYFKLNIVFGFSSSVDELNKFVESKQ